jgi:hypothetical protein
MRTYTQRIDINDDALPHAATAVGDINPPALWIGSARYHRPSWERVAARPLSRGRRRAASASRPTGTSGPYPGSSRVRHPLRTTAKGRLDRRLGPSLSRQAIAVATIRARSSCRERRIRRTANHQRGKELRGARLRFFGKSGTPAASAPGGAASANAGNHPERAHRASDAKGFMSCCPCSKA